MFTVVSLLCVIDRSRRRDLRGIRGKSLKKDAERGRHRELRLPARTRPARGSFGECKARHAICRPWELRRKATLAENEARRERRYGCLRDSARSGGAGTIGHCMWQMMQKRSTGPFRTPRHQCQCQGDRRRYARLHRLCGLLHAIYVCATWCAGAAKRTDCRGIGLRA